MFMIKILQEKGSLAPPRLMKKPGVAAGLSDFQ